MDGGGKEQKYIYLRVKPDNEVAIQMYRKMNYEVLPKDIFAVLDTNLVLRRNILEV